MIYKAWYIDTHHYYSMSLCLLLLLVLPGCILPVKAPPRKDKGKAPAAPEPRAEVTVPNINQIRESEFAAIQATLEAVPQMIARTALKNYRNFLHNGSPPQPTHDDLAAAMEAVKFAIKVPIPNTGQLSHGLIAQAAIRAYRFYLLNGLPQTWMPQDLPRLQQAWQRQEQEGAAAFSSQFGTQIPSLAPAGMDAAAPAPQFQQQPQLFSPIAPRVLAASPSTIVAPSPSAAAHQVPLSSPHQQMMDVIGRRTSQLQQALQQLRAQQLQRALFQRQFSMPSVRTNTNSMASTASNWQGVPVQLPAIAAATGHGDLTPVAGHGAREMQVAEVPKFGAGEGSQQQQYRGHPKEEIHHDDDEGQSAAAGGSGRGGGIPKRGKGVLKRRQHKTTREETSTAPSEFAPGFTAASVGDQSHHQHQLQQPLPSSIATANLLGQSSLMREHHHHQPEEQHGQEHQIGQQRPELHRSMSDIGGAASKIWQPVAIHVPGPELTLVSPHQMNIGRIGGGRGEVGAVRRHEHLQTLEQQGQGQQQIGTSGFRRWRPQPIRVHGPELPGGEHEGGDVGTVHQLPASQYQPEHQQHQQEYIFADDIGRGEEIADNSSSSSTSPGNLNLSLMSPQGGTSSGSKRKKQANLEEGEDSKRKKQG